MFGSSNQRKNGLGTGPAHWKPWAVWDAYRGITTATGVSEWADTVQGFRFEQATTSIQPELTQDTSEFNNKKYLSFDESTNEKLVLNTTDVPLEDQRFFHDGYTSWRMSFVFTPRNIGGGVQPLIGTSVMPTAGIRTDYRDKDIPLERITFYIGNDSSSLSVFLEGVTENVPHLIDCEFDHIAEEIRIRKNGGEWNTTDTSSFTYSSGDSRGSLRLANYGGGGSAFANLDIAHLFITKTIPSTQTSNDMLEWYGKYFAFKNPNLMNPWAIWDASLGVSSGQTTWTDQVSSRRMNENGTISLVSNDPDWNNEDTLELAGTSYYEFDTTDTPLTDQRFFFDGYEDYSVHMLLELTGTGGADAVIDQTNGGSGTGVKIEYQTGAQRFDIDIYDAGTLVAQVVTETGSAPPDVPHYLVWGIKGDILRARLNGGDWIEDASASFITGTDPTTSMQIAPNVGIKCPYMFITKEPMSPMRYEIMLDHLFDRYWAEFDSSVVCAWHSEAIQKDSSDNALRLLDVSHNANHIENDGAGTYATVIEIDGHPVLDFDGSSSYMNLPAAFNEAVTGGEDLPHTVITGMVPEADGGQVWSAGLDGNNRVNMVVSSLARMRTDKEDGTTTKLAQSDGVFPKDEWNVVTSACAGATVRHLKGLEDATNDTDLDVGIIPASSNGKLGAWVDGSINYDGKISAQIYATQELKGGALAKAIRWVQKRTPKR